MHPHPNRPLSWKKKKQQKQTKNKTMAVTTVTITCNWYTLQHWSVSPPQKNYKPQSNPGPSPTPIQSLNICQLIQNISLALSLLCEGGDVTRTLGGGLKKEKHTVANSSLSLNLCMYTRLFFPIEASWHGLNDCIVKMIFGLLTDGVQTHTQTHTLPLGGTAQVHAMS